MKIPLIMGSAGKAAFYNASEAAKIHRGWVLGDFITSSDGTPLTSDFEVKWQLYSLDDARTDWSSGKSGSALTICVSGKQEFTLAPNGVNEKLMTEILTPGRAVFWENSVPHRWKTIEAGYVLTVRRLS